MQRAAREQPAAHVQHPPAPTRPTLRPRRLLLRPSLLRPLLLRPPPLRLRLGTTRPARPCIHRRGPVEHDEPDEAVVAEPVARVDGEAPTGRLQERSRRGPGTGRSASTARHVRPRVQRSSCGAESAHLGTRCSVLGASREHKARLYLALGVCWKTSDHVLSRALVRTAARARALARVVLVSPLRQLRGPLRRLLVEQADVDTQVERGGERVHRRGSRRRRHEALPLVELSVESGACEILRRRRRRTARRGGRRRLVERPARVQVSGDGLLERG